MAKKKKDIRKSLQTKVEKLWKKYCLLRDGKCILCGSKTILQVHHIFSRTKKSLFVDSENGVTLCRDCHCSVTWNDSTKETLRRKIDPAIYERLYEQSLDTSPFLEWKNISWLEMQIKILEDMIAEF